MAERAGAATFAPVTTIPPEARTLIESGALAHLTTLDPDGSPRVTVVWVGLDGDEVVSGHMLRRKKVRNVEHDGRVALSMQTDVVNAHGLQEYLTIHGTARVQEGGAPELLQRLGARLPGARRDVPAVGRRLAGLRAADHARADRGRGAVGGMTRHAAPALSRRRGG